MLIHLAWWGLGYIYDSRADISEGPKLKVFSAVGDFPFDLTLSER